MSWLHGLWHRMHVLARGERYARELDAEQRFHRELEVLSLAGESPSVLEAERAARAARRRFGNSTYYREEARRMTPLDWLDRIRQDVGYAWRGLRRSPGFTTTVVVTLALGLGVNVTMFSLLDRLFVRTPPGVVAPEQVRRLYIDPGYAVTRSGSRVFSFFGYASYRAVRDAWPGTDVALYSQGDSATLGDGANDAGVQTGYASANYFGLLGVRPAVGRFFAADEDRIDSPAMVAVISDDLWWHLSRRDPAMIGRTVRIDLRTFTVIGVAPRGFTGIDLSRVDLWLPVAAFEPAYNGRRRPPWFSTAAGNYFRAIARVAPTANAAELSGQAAAALRAIRSAGSRPDTLSQLLMGPILEARGPSERAMETSMSSRLAGVSLIVLLIACANVANLLLLRATGRRAEMAVRKALGVSTARLYAQLLTESALLSLLGAAAALLLAAWGGVAMRRLMFPSIVWSGRVIDGPMALIVIAVALALGALAALAPAFHLGDRDAGSLLRAGALARGPKSARIQTTMLVAQAALSLVLLVGAGLFVRSLHNVRSIDVGIAAPELLLGSLRRTAQQPRDGSYVEPLREAADALRSVPGVDGAALASQGPMRGWSVRGIYRPGTDSIVRIGDEYPAFSSVSPEYFVTAGMQLLSGRGFEARDRAGAAPVAIVTRWMARNLWPDQQPIGQCLVLGNPTAACTTVVGVVSDVHRSSIIENATPQYFVPLAQDTMTLLPVLVVRARRDRIALVGDQIRRQLVRFVPNAEPVRVITLSNTFSAELHPWELGATLFSAFGLLALAVACVGIYSVVAYAVSQRTHEMGVRIALGATVTDILGLVLAQGAGVVVAGSAIGITASIALGRFVASLLFGVTPYDAGVLVGAATVLCALGALASLLPGWRAARIDPVTALRAQ